MLIGKVETVIVERLRTGVTDTMAPILSALSRPAATVTGLIDDFENLRQVHADNQRLRKENERLYRWQHVAQRLEADNLALRALLNFNPVPDASFVSARVIADSGVVYVRSLLINAGRRDGIEKKQAVIDGKGLVGRITELGNRSARLLLLTDLNSRIPVTVEGAGIRAILAGDNTNEPRLLHVGDPAELSAGDRIVTSGHGGVFPPGLPVGVIATVSEGEVRVQTFLDQDSLEYVRIVRYETPAAEPVAGDDVR
jgi:rod shape-determining protein MreC